MKQWRFLLLLLILFAAFAAAVVSNNDWAKSLLSGAVGGLLVVVAQEAVHWWRRPILKLSFSAQDDCLAKTKTINPQSGIETGKAIYVRIKVENEGELLARACRAYLIKAELWVPSAKFAPTIYSDSLPLQWSCRAAVVGGEPIDLPRGVAQYVDVLASGFNREVENTPYSTIRFASPPPVRYDGLFSGRGARYRLTILVSGDGVAPEQLSIDVKLGAAWDDVQATTA